MGQGVVICDYLLKECQCQLFVCNGEFSIFITLQIALSGNLKTSYMELVPVCTDVQF